MTLGDIIKRYRNAHDNMSMDTFSEKSGISKAYIGLYEVINLQQVEIMRKYGIGIKAHNAIKRNSM